MQAQHEVLQEVLESWDILHTEGEQAWFPMTQLIKQLHAQQKEIDTQLYVIVPHQHQQNC
jgi:hypothetical protein